MKHLILGGARSGKSRFAEKLAESSGKNLVYLATAQALDEEMGERILHHRKERGTRWHTVEEALTLANCLQRHASPNTCIVVDCLTLWLTNILLAGDSVLVRENRALLDVLPQLSGDILLVSNEVGWGVIPADPLSRRFVDEAGRLHQRLAQLCSDVTLVSAGLPLPLKTST